MPGTSSGACVSMSLMTFSCGGWWNVVILAMGSGAFPKANDPFRRDQRPEPHGRRVQPSPADTSVKSAKATSSKAVDVRLSSEASWASVMRSLNTATAKSPDVAPTAESSKDWDWPRRVTQERAARATQGDQKQ